MAKIDQAHSAIAGDGTPVERIPPVAFVLTAAIAVIGSNSLVLAPIAPDVSRAFGVPVQGVMAASAAFGLGTAFSALFLARHMDRYGAWHLLRLAFAVLAAGLAASAVAPSAIVLGAAQLAAGVAAGVALPAIYSNAASVAPPGRESETVGIVLTGWTLSLVAGVSLSAVLADLVHWRAVYAVVALLAIVAFAALWADGRRDVRLVASALSPLTTLAIPGVLPLLAACAVFMGGFYGVYAYLGHHVNVGLGQPVMANGLITVSYGLGFGGAAFLDRVVQRYPPQRALPSAFLVVGVIYAAIAALSQNYAALLGCVFLWGLFNHFGLNLLIVRLTAIDPARRGAIMGLNSATTYLAASAGTLAFGPIYAHAGFAAAAWVAAGLAFCAAFAAAR